MKILLPTEIPPGISVGRLHLQDILEIVHGFGILLFRTQNARDRIQGLR